MKLKKIILLSALLLIIGGFGYIATTDIKVEQQTVTETIPNDRFYKND